MIVHLTKSLKLHNDAYLARKLIRPTPKFPFQCSNEPISNVFFTISESAAIQIFRFRFLVDPDTKPELPESQNGPKSDSGSGSGWKI